MTVIGRRQPVRGSIVMEKPKILLAFVLLTATASAASWEEDLSRCSTDCPFSGDPKLKYDLGKIYSYSYSVKSEVGLVFDSATETEWSSTIEMTWITPCDMAIKFNNIRINGTEGPVAAGSLETYPLVVAITDGHVQHVCSHPDDDISSVNLKRGIATAMQNSLPSLTATDSPLTISETDVVGKCPTIYKTEVEETMTIVRKEKNHKDCQNHFSTASSGMRSFLQQRYMQVQESNCKQEITNGLYTTIVCEDKKRVHMSYGNSLPVNTYQQSRLQLQSESGTSSSNTASNSQTEMVQGSLLYDHTVKKDPSLVAQLDETMSLICEKTMGIVEPDTASLVTKALQLMRLVPEVSVKQTLEKIRSGHFCTNYRKLESIFLDIVAFIHDSSAVEVLVNELISGAATEDHTTLYSQTLCLISQPSAYAIEALKPLMETSQSLSTATLCGASMVNEFCQNNHQCQEEESVRNITNILSDKLEEQCSSLHDEDTRTAALTTFKALGNIGVITPEVSIAVIECMESQDIDEGVSVAAVQSFRNAECGDIPTVRLTDFAMNSSVNTEVRIESYLAVIRCAGETELESIISGMVNEENTQVRSFILSHLANLQRSSVPYKQPLKHLLRNVTLPVDSEVDITRRSRNVDMTLSVPPLGVKADIESNILYTPEFNIPRSLNVNVTMDLLGILTNMIEAGLRFEGMEGYLGNHWGKRYMKPRIDDFVRFMGQERYFESRSESPATFFVMRFIWQFFRYLDQIQFSLLKDIDTARALQHQEVYSLPTIQGALFNYDYEIVAVVSLNQTGFQNLYRRRTDSENLLNIQPGLSVQTRVFAGFDSHVVKEGLYSKSNVTSSNDFSFNVHSANSEFEIQLNVPDRIEVFSIGGEIFMMRKIIGLPEQKRSTQSGSYSPTRQACFRGLRYLLGLQFCADTRVNANPRRPTEADVSIQIRVEKIDPSVKAYSLKFSPNNNMHSRQTGVKIQAKVIGGPRQQELTLHASHAYKNRREMITLLFDTSNEKGGLWLSMRSAAGKVTFEGIMKFNPNHPYARGLYYGLKVDLTTRGRLEEQEYKLKVYLSRTKNYPQDSQLLGGKLNLRLNGDETSVDFKLKTTNATRLYVSFSLGGGIDLTRYGRYHIPSRIRKYEFLGELGFLDAVSYLRKTNDSSHESLFAINRRGREMVGVRTVQIAEGAWQDDNSTCTTTLTASYVGYPVFEVSNEIFHGINRTGMTTEVLRSHDRAKMAEFVVLL